MHFPPDTWPAAAAQGDSGDDDDDNPVGYLKTAFDLDKKIIMKECHDIVRHIPGALFQASRMGAWDAI